MMTEFIRAENVSVSEIPGRCAFSISGGEMIIVVTPKYEVNSLLTKLIIGMEVPDSGKMFLFAADTATISKAELLQLRQRVGIAFGSGGLVSNLKVWENITLPLYFNSSLSSAEIEVRGLAILNRLGYDANLMNLPALLTFSQRKLIGMARAMLMEPDVIIYESSDSGMSQVEKNNFFKIATEFHCEKPERASVFITSNQELPNSLPEAVVINLTKGLIK